ncbi:MAG: class I SAM-dependent methyltransferase [Candidatus Helarchaeota archaeon]
MKNPNSSSIHTINADKKLNLIQLGLYFLKNWKNNLYPLTNIDNNLEIRNFRCNDLQKYWSNLNIKAPSNFNRIEKGAWDSANIKGSPNRKLINIFLLNLPWDRIRDELNQINILDIGCGKGVYSKLLINYSKNIISNYYGMDINSADSWRKFKAFSPSIHFKKFDGRHFYNNFPKFINFFLSISTIEHMTEDLAFFRDLQKYISHYKKPIIQVHFFPSKVCLKLFGMHGIRNYTPRNVSKITLLFNNTSQKILYNLGGSKCIKLHFKYITMSGILNRIFRRENIRLRDNRRKEYLKLLFDAINLDMKTSQKNPAYYALVILSNWKNKLF